MPKTLPALVAVAVIAFSIGFNTARYPIVWEMVGASAHLSEELGNSNLWEDSRSFAGWLRGALPSRPLLQRLGWASPEKRDTVAP